MRQFPRKKGRYTNLKFNWENFIFHLCPNVAIFLKNVFIFKDRTLKKINIERTRISRWSDEKMRRMWFGLEIDVVGRPPLVYIRLLGLQY